MQKINIKSLINPENKKSLFYSFLKQVGDKDLLSFLKTDKRRKFIQRIIKHLLKNKSLLTIEGIISKYNIKDSINFLEGLLLFATSKKVGDFISKLHNLSKQQKEHIEEFVHILQEGSNTQEVKFKVLCDEIIFRKLYKLCTISIVQYLSKEVKNSTFKQTSNNSEVLNNKEEHETILKAESKSEYDNLGSNQQIQQVIDLLKQENINERKLFLLALIKKMEVQVAAEVANRLVRDKIISADGYKNAVRVFRVMRHDIRLLSEIANSALKVVNKVFANPKNKQMCSSEFYKQVRLVVALVKLEEYGVVVRKQIAIEAAY